jgi:uncharacterized protein YlxW (UPF0749 family)
MAKEKTELSNVPAGLRGAMHAADEERAELLNEINKLNKALVKAGRLVSEKDKEIKELAALAQWVAREAEGEKRQ